MYIIIDDRDIVAGGYATGFDREGVSSAGIEAAEFREWIGKISDADMHAVEAFVIGDCGEREALSRMIRERSNAPVLCLNERHSLDDTLGLQFPPQFVIAGTVLIQKRRTLRGIQLHGVVEQFLHLLPLLAVHLSVPRLISLWSQTRAIAQVA